MTDIGLLKGTVERFLRNHGMHAADLSLESCTQSFLEHMARGLAGSPSSLRMIPTYIEAAAAIPADKPVIAIDAGGTNFRVATIRFDEGRSPRVERAANFEMPGVKEEISLKDFFRTVAAYISPNLADSDRIGFCFSYPTEIFPDRDGRLIRFCKEVRAKEVEGQIIGRCLNRALETAGFASRHVVLLNDTVATLLAGQALSRTRAYDGCIGFILGTGTNCCYVEQNRNIQKCGGLGPDGAQIINIESGSFAGMPRGSIDLDFDALTLDPGQYTFEKMISGAYMGGLTLQTLKTAACEGLFSPAYASALGSLDRLETRQLNRFLRDPSRESIAVSLPAPEEDRVVQYLIAGNLVERAAKLTAANLASAVLSSGRGANPCYPVCITAEGTTFYELKSLRESIDHHLADYLTCSKGRYYEFVRVENATLVGAAIAGLTN
jgi:hexokinase